MTDEQYESLRRLMLELAVRVEAIEMHLKRQDKDADARMRPLQQLITGALEEATHEDRDILDVFTRSVRN